MYCRNCGKQVEDGRELCVECEATNNTTTATGSENVQVIKEVVNNETNSNTSNNSNNVNSNTNNNVNTNVVKERKSKVAAGLFGIFLGCFGVHNFYLGYTGKAIAQLLITVLSCFTLAVASQIWGIIEGILILSGSIDKDADGVTLRD